MQPVMRTAVLLLFALALLAVVGSAVAGGGKKHKNKKDKGNDDYGCTKRKDMMGMIRSVYRRCAQNMPSQMGMFVRRHFSRGASTAACQRGSMSLTGTTCLHASIFSCNSLPPSHLACNVVWFHADYCLQGQVRYFEAELKYREKELGVKCFDVDVVGREVGHAFGVCGQQKLGRDYWMTADVNIVPFSMPTAML
jgi:hypothetical protein